MSKPPQRSPGAQLWAIISPSTIYTFPSLLDCIRACYVVLQAMPDAASYMKIERIY